MLFFLPLKPKVLLLSPTSDILLVSEASQLSAGFSLDISALLFDLNTKKYKNTTFTSIFNLHKSYKYSIMSENKYKKNQTNKKNQLKKISKAGKI